MAIEIKKTKIRIKTLGDIELNSIFGDNSEYTSKIINDQSLSNKEFVQNILYNQLIKPKISMKEFLQLSDNDLETIGKAIIENEWPVFRHVKDTGDFYKDFRMALEFFEEEQSEIIKNLLSKTSQIIIDLRKGEHLYKNGWIITPYIKDKLVKDQLLTADLLRKTNSQINRIYEDYFTNDNYREIELMIKSWKTNKLFEPRIPIFLSCLIILRTFRKNKKNLKKVNPCSVIMPVLISQIDGISLSYARNKGLILNITRLKDKVTGRHFDNLSMWMMMQPAASFSEPNAVKLLYFVLFANTYPVGQEKATHRSLEKPKVIRPFLIYNRHKILHGEDIKYGTIDNLLRCFLVLDFFANLR